MPIIIIALAVVGACFHVFGFEELLGVSFQEEYYNNFGKLHKAAIIASVAPHLWTTDAASDGKVSKEMKKRLSHQERLVEEYFWKGLPVIDIGCGFGRQAYMVATKGFFVFGIDTSKVFIDIAKDLFAKHKYPGEFVCMDIMKKDLRSTYKNVLLFDVLEHIVPYRRKRFARRIFNVTQPGGIVIMSLPHDTSGITWKKRIKQYFSYYTNKEEHPYAIPQRKDVERIFKNLFTVVNSQVTEETDYYVLNASERLGFPLNKS